MKQAVIVLVLLLPTTVFGQSLTHDEEIQSFESDWARWCYQQVANEFRDCMNGAASKEDRATCRSNRNRDEAACES